MPWPIVDGLFLLTTADPNGILVELSFGVDNAIDREIAAGSVQRA
jgi:hypothetical protein